MCSGPDPASPAPSGAWAGRGGGKAPPVAPGDASRGDAGRDAAGLGSRKAGGSSQTLTAPVFQSPPPVIRRVPSGEKATALTNSQPRCAWIVSRHLPLSGSQSLTVL